MSTDTPVRPAGEADVLRWVGARNALDATRQEVEALDATRGVSTFRSQLDLLERRLVADPRTFRDMFIADGMAAVAWEFRQPELSRDFVVRLWDMLLRDDDVSTVLVWVDMSCLSGGWSCWEGRLEVRGGARRRSSRRRGGRRSR